MFKVYSWMSLVLWGAFTFTIVALLLVIGTYVRIVIFLGQALGKIIGHRKRKERCKKKKLDDA